MAIGYVLCNRHAGKREDVESVRLIKETIDGELVFKDIETIENYADFFSKFSDGDYLIIAGGDGTLNRFVNDTEGLEFPGEILYFPNGTGNDFAHELGYQKNAKPFSAKAYLTNLPTVIINGKSYRFLNGVGYGIDGYCCEVGDAMKASGETKINYTAIVIKGLLFHYQPTAARVTVDGVTHSYKKVWLAPTMHGKCYGGGMMPTPDQERGSGELSTMVFHSSGKLKTLMIFPSIFKGKHIKHTKQIDIFKGKQITVEFDRPTALQIDGETILGVTSYTALAAVKVKEKATV